MDTGKRIRNRRKELGISADDLAQTIGCSRSTIFRYENGDIEKVPSDFLEPIASALHTTPSYLMGWTDDPRDYENDPDIQVPYEFTKMGIDAEKYAKFKEAEAKDVLELDGVYLSFAKEAQQSGIDPDDLKLAIDTIRKLRGE